MSQDAYIQHTTPPAEGAPLVFAFHGTGGDEHQFAGLVPDLLPGAGLVAPRGDVSEGGAARFFRRTGEGVYDMADLSRATARMRDYVAAHRAAHPGRPAFGLGYSNGANILASVLFEAPELFDRAVLMHPLIPWTPAPQPGLSGRPVLIAAGRRDPICPWSMTATLGRWLGEQGAEVETVAHDGGHEIRPSEFKAARSFLAAGVPA